MVVYGLLEGEIDDYLIPSPTSPSAEKKRTAGNHAKDAGAVGMASPGAPAAARSPRRESDVARLVRLAAVDAMMIGDRRKSAEDHRVRLSQPGNGFNVEPILDAFSYSFRRSWP